MSISKRFVITKNDINNAITYLEYEKIKGFDVKPKEDVAFEDMINVSKMVIINPSLIDKLVDKKCKKTLEKIIKMTSIIYDEEDDDSSGQLGFILNEIEKFKQLLEYKYHKYMEEKSCKILLKKLEIIESEVKLRKLSLDMKQMVNNVDNKKGKGR